MTEQEILAEEEVLQNQNLKDLVHKMRLIPDVMQVRWWLVLKRRLRTGAGANAVSINTYVKERQDIDNDRYTQLSTVIPEAVWNDPTQHDDAVAKMQDTVSRYIASGIITTGY